MKKKLPEGRTDGRGLAGNNPLSVLTRLSGEIAYCEKRLCIRRSHVVVRGRLHAAAEAVESAIQYLEDLDDQGNL